jgi:hypothetical protein
MDKEISMRFVPFLIFVVSILFIAGFVFASSDCNNACMAEKALLGDKKAAEYLATDRFKFPKERRYWTLISAENGSFIDQYNIGIEYLESPQNKFESIRGRYWMCKSASSGHAVAAKYIKERGVSCGGVDMVKAVRRIE